MDWLRADIASCILSVIAQLLIGRKKWYGWLFPVANLVPLTIINIQYHLWAFHIYNAGMLVVFLWNCWSWKRARS